MNQLKTAIAYHEAGLCVLPAHVRSKQPAVPWRDYQNRRPSTQQIRDWFSNPHHENIAIVCGAASDGLVVRDFDDKASYDKWARRHPGLAKRLPTATTSRGHHVYVRTRQAVRTTAFDDGEIRGDRSIVIAPESVHQSGVIYSWLDGIPSEFPMVDPTDSGLCQSWVPGSEYLPAYRGNSCYTEAQETQILKQSVSLCNTTVATQVERAIVRSIPPTVAMRNRSLFKLARELKAIPEISCLPASELRWVVEAWLSKARQFIVNATDVTTNLVDFANAWGSVKYAAGSSPIDDIVRRSKDSLPPPEVAESTNAALVLLATICRELQRDRGDRPFFLDCRTAAKHIGVDHMAAFRWLKGFCAIHLLEQVSSGSQAKRKANEYRYLGKM